MRNPADRLHDILDAIAAVERYTDAGRERFDGDELVRTWVVHHLQVIGEAARAVPEPVLRRAPEIPWHLVVAARIDVADWEARLVASLPEELQGSLPTVEELERELGENLEGES